MLLRDLLETDRAIHEQFGQEAALSTMKAGLGYGREWLILLRDLYTVVGVLGESKSSRPWSDFSRFIKHITTDAAQYPEGQAIRDYWLLAADAWGVAISLESPEAPRIRDEFVFTLHNLVWLPGRVVGEATSGPEVPRRLASAYVELMKKAIDLDNEAAALECVEYFDNSFDRHCFNRSTEGGNSDMPVFVTVCLLAIYAWVLYRVGERKKEDMPRLRRRLEKIARHFPVWNAAKSLRRDAFDEYLRSSWWEVEMKGGRGGGVMVMSRYETLAAILTGARPPSPENATTEDFEQADVVLRAFADDAQGRLAGFPADLADITNVQSELISRLIILTETQKTREAEALAAAPILTERVELFRDTILSNVRESRSSGLAALFPQKVGEPSTLLGWVSRVPKEYFVESDVHAEPEELARSLAIGIERSEEARVLKALAEHATNRESVDRVRVAEFLERPESDGLLMVSNSWQVAETFGLGDQVLRDDTRRTYQVWTDDDPFVVFVDPRQSVAVLRGIPDAEDVTDVVEESLGIVVGVSELRDDEMCELADTEARREVLGSVRVKVLEPFGLRAHDEPKIVWFDLPED